MKSKRKISNYVAISSNTDALRLAEYTDEMASINRDDTLRAAATLIRAQQERIQKLRTEMLEAARTLESNQPWEGMAWGNPTPRSAQKALDTLRAALTEEG